MSFNDIYNYLWWSFYVPEGHPYPYEVNTALDVLDAVSLDSLMTEALHHELYPYPCCSSLDHPLAVFLYHSPFETKII
jgi:hypothetical protein